MRMRIVRRLLVASLLGGCSSSVPTSPSQPLPESFEVSGTLFETVDGVARPLAGRQLRLLSISVGPCGRSRCEYEREDTLFTDDNGRYTARIPPNSRVFVYARDAAGPLQPCLASAVVDKDTTIDVQVAPAGNPPTPPPAASPMITGFVYETTSEGRRPLRGVVVWLEVGQGIYLVAITQTDEAGHFFLCRVNAPVGMGVSSYREWFRPIPGIADSFFEIELRR